MPRKDRCPKCGVKRSPGYNLCFTCGYRFVGESQQKILPRDNSHQKLFPPISDLLQSKGKSESSKKCAQCGNIVSEGAKFCFTCGKKVVDQQKSPSRQEQKGEKPIRNCPQCGEENLEGAKFCYTCGKRIEDKQIIPSIEEKVEKKPIRSCPKCGEELLTGAKFCFTCGIKVEEIRSEPLESESISPILEIGSDIPKTSSPPKPQFKPSISETNKEIPTVITTEELTPIPPTVEIKTRKRKIYPQICNFCGIRIPKKTSFCIQCGMIIKIR